MTPKMNDEKRLEEISSDVTKLFDQITHLFARTAEEYGRDNPELGSILTHVLALHAEALRANSKYGDLWEKSFQRIRLDFRGKFKKDL